MSLIPLVSYLPLSPRQSPLPGGEGVLIRGDVEIDLRRTVGPRYPLLTSVPSRPHHSFPCLVAGGEWKCLLNLSVDCPQIRSRQRWPARGQCCPRPPVPPSVCSISAPCAGAALGAAGLSSRGTATTGKSVGAGDPEALSRDTGTWKGCTGSSRMSVAGKTEGNRRAGCFKR